MVFGEQDCYRCEERRVEAQDLSALVARHKKERDEALGMVEHFRMRYAEVLNDPHARRDEIVKLALAARDAAEKAARQARDGLQNVRDELEAERTTGAHLNLEARTLRGEVSRLKNELAAAMATIYRADADRTDYQKEKAAFARGLREECEGLRRQLQEQTDALRDADTRLAEHAFWPVDRRAAAPSLAWSALVRVVDVVAGLILVLGPLAALGYAVLAWLGKL